MTLSYYTKCPRCLNDFTIFNLKKHLNSRYVCYNLKLVLGLKKEKEKKIKAKERKDQKRKKLLQIKNIREKKRQKILLSPNFVFKA